MVNATHIITRSVNGFDEYNTEGMIYLPISIQGFAGDDVANARCRSVSVRITCCVCRGHVMWWWCYSIVKRTAAGSLHCISKPWFSKLWRMTLNCFGTIPDNLKTPIIVAVDGNVSSQSCSSFSTSRLTAVYFQNIVLGNCY